MVRGGFPQIVVKKVASLGIYTSINSVTQPPAIGENQESKFPTETWFFPGKIPDCTRYARSFGA
jgi:hypothetical protein